MLAAMRPPDIAHAAQRYVKRVARRRTAPRREPTGREKYLARTASRERAKAMVSEADAVGTRGTQSDTLRLIANERMVGANDLFDLNYLELAIAIARGVARIHLPDGNGTGVLVGPGLLMTNNHVIESATAARGAIVQLDYQENNAGELLPVQAFRLEPERFFVTDPALDFTVVAVAGVSSSGRPIGEYPWTKLIATLGKAEKGDAVNIIQHPLGGLKQIAFRNNTIIEIPDGQPDFLYYTTDTQPGSSGAPCFNDQWEMVALHHSPVPATRGKSILKKNGKPYRDGVDSPDSIEWIANEGARVSAIVTALRAMPLSGDAAAIRDRFLDAAPPNPVELARGTSRGSSNGASRRVVSGGALSVRVDVAGDEIRSVVVERDGSGVAAAAVAALAGDGGTAQRSTPLLLPGGVEAVVIDPNWADRRGYDRDFLDVRVPLPALGASQKKITAVVPPEYRRSASDRFGLHYHHYSLTFNERRRMAWYSAANVDGDRRFQLTRGDDKWFIDPRIDDPSSPVRQMGEELYAAAKTDRGHLTRYLDVAWGDAEDEAITATNDTFHFTNCALQLSAFNQGKDRWQGLERFLLENKARKEKRRISVVTGPVFKDGDPLYRNPDMSYSARIPLEFWKVCALIRQDGTLSVTAFRLGQHDLASLPGFVEKFDVKPAQVTLAEIESVTGLSFGSLKKHDHFAAGGAPGTLEIARSGGGGGKRRAKPIGTFEDIVV